MPHKPYLLLSLYLTIYGLNCNANPLITASTHTSNPPALSSNSGTLHDIGQDPDKTITPLYKPGQLPLLRSITSNKEPLAIYQQALNYLLGRNGEIKSAKRAAALFKFLAQQNWSSAQHMLGNMYLSGKGVEKNNLLAYKWLSLASKNNLQLAEAILEKRKRLYIILQNDLSLQSLKKVETWIAEWKPESQQPQIN